MTDPQMLTLRPHGVLAPVVYGAFAMFIAIGAFYYQTPASALLALPVGAVAIALAMRRIDIALDGDTVTVTWKYYLSRKLPLSFPRASIISVLAETIGDDARSLIILTKQGQVSLTSAQETGDLESAAFRIGAFLGL